MWTVKYIREAVNDLKKLDKFIQKKVLAGIARVAINPLPQNEGGYGKPLGKKGGPNLTGFFKIKFKSMPIRVVYALNRETKVFTIIAVSERDDNYCYGLAVHRKKKYKSERE